MDIDKTMTTILISVGIFFAIIIFIGMGFYMGNGGCACGLAENGNNCPCPNYKYVDEVEEFTGREACCPSTWLEMCEEYQKATNKNFECFQ